MQAKFGRIQQNFLDECKQKAEKNLQKLKDEQLSQD